MSLAVVKYDGSVVWIPQVIVESTCSVDVTLFPKDEQNCYLKVRQIKKAGKEYPFIFLFACLHTLRS